MTSETSALGYLSDDYDSDEGIDTSFDPCSNADSSLSSGASSLFQSSPFSSNPFSSGPSFGGGNVFGTAGGSGMLGNASFLGGQSNYLGGACNNGNASPEATVAQLSGILNKIASMLPSTINAANGGNGFNGPSNFNGSNGPNNFNGYNGPNSFNGMNGSQGQNCFNGANIVNGQGNGQNPFGQHDEKFSEFHGASVGDPHDSFSGKTAGQRSVDDHWDDMRNHQDLLHSNSFKGGIRVATQTTAPDANGKTMNGKVTVHLNGERDSVSLDADGNTVLSQDGHWKSLKPGNTVTLKDGSVISEAEDHSLSICKKSNDGEITTLLKTNGDGGVDVSMDGKNARIGGYLTRHATAA